MNPAHHFDVIVIGTGAGGGTMVHQLASTGLRVLVLERGGFLPRESQNWDTRAVFTESRYKAGETWLDRDGAPFHPGIHYFVGGNTKVYGAALLRFRAEDFGAVRHHGGISPAWPIQYDDLEPWYAHAEQLYHVHGARGADPTEPWASGPYAHAPVTHEPRIQELADDLRRLGHRPFPLPVGIMLDEKDPWASRCIRCQTCDGFPCLVEAKADADVVAIRPALRQPNITLLTCAFAQRLVTSASGREVTAVDVEHAGRVDRYSADMFVVACGAVNSAALLLRSRNDQHPHGLANRSGVVGRHYMCHNNSALLAISRQENPTVFQKTLGLNDFYFGADDFEFPMGHIQLLGKSNAEMLREDAPRFAPGFALEFLARHALDFWLTSEDLPDPENRVTLEPDGTIRLAYTPNNLGGHQHLVKRLKRTLEQLGSAGRFLPNAIYLSKKIPLAGTAHQCGTVRFGTDPSTSALDVDCRAHDVDNLYVTDGSFFVSSTAVNPALTIMANALRVSQVIATRLGVREEVLVR